MMGRSYRSSKKRREEARDRRAKLANLGLCINAPLPAGVIKHPGKGRRRVEHGPRKPGHTKCDRCLDVQAVRLEVAA